MSDWNKFKVTELKAELKRRGLAQTGLKAELVARLDAHEAAASQPQDDGYAGKDGSAGKDGEPLDVLSDKTVEPDHLPNADPVEPGNTGAPEQASNAQVKPAQPELKPSPTSNGDDTVVTATECNASGADASPSAYENRAPSHEVPGRATSDSATAEPMPSASTPNGPSAAEGATNRDAIEAAASEVAADALKRKRRSASPAPKEEAAKRRRAQEAPRDPGQESEAHIAPSQDDWDQNVPMTDKAPAPSPAAADARDALGDKEPLPADIKPALHKQTAAIYINNLMRPLREIDLQAHLVNLAAPDSGAQIPDVIDNFYLDAIRTHAFVVFNSTSAAVRVRNELHGQVWPNESNRKALFVDFVPEDKVVSWIALEEERTRDKRTGSRCEVVYQPTGDGDVEALLQSNPIASSSATQHMGRAAPASTGIEGAPTGPRGYRPSTAQPSRFARPLHSDAADPRESRQDQPFPREQPRPHAADGAGEQTMAQPVIYFEAVSVTLARRRLQDMRSLYTRDVTRPMDREINRYSFQDDDQFVDRGREVFEGIRPPHRQQAMDREMRRGGGRGGRLPYRGGSVPYRPRGDRYIPGSGGPVDDHDTRQGEDDGRRW